MKKIKVYELDFGDTNLLTTDKKEILEWISSDLYDMGDDDELNFKITIRHMTQKEYDSLPEWS